MDNKTFTAGLAYLRKHAPENDMLPIIESMGYGIVACAYLEAELNALPVPTLPDPVIHHEERPEMAELNARLNDLYIQRAKSSNKLHDCITDKQRADVVQEIIFIQGRIKTYMHTKDFFQLHGKMPEIEEDDKFVIPDNPIELMKKKENLTRSIQRARANLRYLEKEGKDTTRQEKSLKKLNEHKLIIEGEISRQALQG